MENVIGTGLKAEGTCYNMTSIINALLCDLLRLSFNSQGKCQQLGLKNSTYSLMEQWFTNAI